MSDSRVVLLPNAAALSGSLRLHQTSGAAGGRAEDRGEVSLFFLFFLMNI